MIKIKRYAAALCLDALAIPAAAQAPWVMIRFPQDKTKGWWDDAWWQRGQMAVPANHEAATLKTAYRSGDAAHRRFPRRAPGRAMIQAIAR